MFMAVYRCSFIGNLSVGLLRTRANWEFDAIFQFLVVLSVIGCTVNAAVCHWLVTPVEIVYNQRLLQAELEASGKVLVRKASSRLNLSANVISNSSIKKSSMSIKGRADSTDCIHDNDGHKDADGYGSDCGDEHCNEQGSNVDNAHEHRARDGNVQYSCNSNSNSNSNSNVGFGSSVTNEDVELMQLNQIPQRMLLDTIGTQDIFQSVDSKINNNKNKNNDHSHTNASTSNLAHSPSWSSRMQHHDILGDSHSLNAKLQPSSASGGKSSSFIDSKECNVTTSKLRSDLSPKFTSLSASKSLLSSSLGSSSSPGNTNINTSVNGDNAQLSNKFQLTSKSYMDGDQDHHNHRNNPHNNKNSSNYSSGVKSNVKPAVVDKQSNGRTFGAASSSSSSSSASSSASSSSSAVSSLSSSSSVSKRINSSIEVGLPSHSTQTQSQTQTQMQCTSFSQPSQLQQSVQQHQLQRSNSLSVIIDEMSHSSHAHSQLHPQLHGTPVHSRDTFHDHDDHDDHRQDHDHDDHRQDHDHDHLGHRVLGAGIDRVFEEDVLDNNVKDEYAGKCNKSQRYHNCNAGHNRNDRNNENIIEGDEHNIDNTDHDQDSGDLQMDKLKRGSGNNISSDNSTGPNCWDEVKFLAYGRLKMILAMSKDRYIMPFNVIVFSISGLSRGWLFATLPVYAGMIMKTYIFLCASI
jgi:hypothetical protein